MTNIKVGDWVYVDGDKSRAYPVLSVRTVISKWAKIEGKNSEEPTGEFKVDRLTKQSKDDVKAIAKSYKVGDTIRGYDSTHEQWIEGEIEDVDPYEWELAYFVNEEWLDTCSVYLVKKLDAPKFMVGDIVSGQTMFGVFYDNVTVIEVDGRDSTMTYRVRTNDGDRKWLRTDTVKASHHEFKVGDYVTGKGFMTGRDFEGEIRAIHCDGDVEIVVDGIFRTLSKSSLKKAERPVVETREFKIGDRVKFTDKCSTRWDFGPHKDDTRRHFGVIVPESPSSRYIYGVKIDGYGWTGGVNDEHIELVEPVTETEPASESIVCLIENGSYKPSKKPFVHDTESDAKAEAERLALKNPGKKFAVLKLTYEAEAEAVLKQAA